MSLDRNFKVVKLVSKTIQFGMRHYWSIMFVLFICVFFCGVATVLELFFNPLKSLIISGGISIAAIVGFFMGLAKRLIPDPEDSGFLKD
jgi:hypothetical protein